MALTRPAFAALMIAVLVAFARAQQSAPAPEGQLVDVGGRRLHQICSGAGSPTVIVENGAGSFSVEWIAVQTEIAKFMRVCAYDRAGYAWSDKGPAQDTIEQTVDDLHVLLQKTPRPPYVFVGASLGAIYVRAYQRRFPQDVAGIVFVDGTHDEAITFMSDGKRLPISVLSADELRAAYAQYEREAPQPAAGRPDQEPLSRLPAEVQRMRFWAFEKLIREVGLLPKGIDAAESWRREFTELRRRRLAEAHPLGNLPLVALERTEGLDPTWHAQQIELAALSAVGKHVSVAGSGHMIHIYRPDVVATAIREVVTAARSATTAQRR